MKRLPNWPDLFTAAVEARKRTEFVRGETDCIPEFCSIIQSYTGTDLIADLRGTYKGDEEAFALVDNLQDGLLGEFRRRLSAEGCEEIEPMRAIRGDIAYYDLTHKNPRLFGMGLFDSHGVLVKAQRGFDKISRSSVLRAWHIS